MVENTQFNDVLRDKRDEILTAQFKASSQDKYALSNNELEIIELSDQVTRAIQLIIAETFCKRDATTQHLQALIRTLVCAIKNQIIEEMKQEKNGYQQTD